MGRCSAIKAGGGRCGATAMQGYELCFGHRPDLAEERRRNARKGGRSGGRGRGAGGELAEVKGLLRELTDAVLSGEVKVGTATAANQLLNSRLRAVELERRTSDLNSLLERLEELEQRADRLRGA